MRKWASFALFLLLVGCQSMTVEERRAGDRQTCRDYGLRYLNDAFAECMMRLDLERRAARRSDFNQFERDIWARRHAW
jgi:hypothetical protein